MIKEGEYTKGKIAMKRILLIGIFIFLLSLSTLTAIGCMPLTAAAMTVKGICVGQTEHKPASSSVAGYVYMNQKLMPNFTIQLKDNYGKILAQGKTNQQGHFIIKDVPPGEYEIQILTFAGTPHPKTFNIKVRPGRTEIVDIDLGGQPIVPGPSPR